MDFVSGGEKSGNQSKTCSGEVSNWFGGLAEQSDQQGVRVDDPSRDFSDGIEVLVPPVGGWVCEPLQCSSEEILVISGGSKLSGSGLLSGGLDLGKALDLPPNVSAGEDSEEGVVGRSRGDSDHSDVGGSNMVANHQISFNNNSSEPGENSPGSGKERTDPKVVFSRLELIRKVVQERSFPGELAEAVISRYSRGGPEVEARWSSFCKWAGQIC